MDNLTPNSTFNNNIPPDRYAVCPVCGKSFAQPLTGRKRIYCSKICRQKEFRRVSDATKRGSAERLALLNQHLSIGDWRLNILPEWPCYRCLICGQAVGRGPAWYDHHSFNQTRGVYRRIICRACRGE